MYKVLSIFIYSVFNALSEKDIVYLKYRSKYNSSAYIKDRLNLSAVFFTYKVFVYRILIGGLLYMKTIINENQRGFLFKNGKFIKMLSAGKYFTFGGKEIEKTELNSPVKSKICALNVLLKDKELLKQIVVTEVKDNEVALHFVNGTFKELLYAGKYAFWSVYDKHEFNIINTSNPEVSADVPVYIFRDAYQFAFKKVEVQEYQKGRLYYNNKFIKLLDAGTYYFWKNDISVRTEIVDVRLTQLNITGQEILTMDKVSIRVNLFCNYKITDAVKVSTEVDNYIEQLHITAQLAIREYIGKYKIDEILENKQQISEYVFSKLKEKSKNLYVDIADAGVKDIILPGEIRDIMNTVLVAEKRAQANVITRREEVASTRSLLNTAKLMDENKTLYKLKELEYLERICENVGNITVNGNTDLISQLSNIICRNIGVQNEKVLKE